MKILYISDRGKGGIKNHVRCLCECFEGVDGIEVYCIGEDDPFAGKSGHDWREWEQIRRIVKTFKPDLIHLHTLPLLMCLYIKLFVNVPCFVSLHTPCRKVSLKDRILHWLIKPAYYLPVSTATWEGFKDERGRFFEIVSNKIVMLLILGVCLVMAAIGLGDYNSPFAMAVSGSMFFIFMNFSIPSWLGKVCEWFALSMFSVYLIHSHGHAWGYFKIIEDYLLANFVSMSIVYVLTALIIFIVCLLADLPRRWILRFYRKHHD